MVISTPLPSSPSQVGRTVINICIHTEEEDLEQAVKGDEACTVIRVALCKLVSDQHHGNAARQANEDDPRHVFRITWQEQHRQYEDEDGSNYPMLDEGNCQNLNVSKYLRQGLVSDFRQWRIHHQNQSDSDPVVPVF